MKRITYILIVTMFLVGCALVRPTKQNTASQDKLKKATEKIADTKTEISLLDLDRIDQTANYAFGIKYSLNKVENITPPVATALKLNDRIISIVGSPTMDEMKKMEQIVELMNSEVNAEKEKGLKLLEKKDKEITELQETQELLKEEYELQIAELISKGKDIAKSNDEKQTTLDSMSGMLGLNAVWWGLKKFFISSFTIIVIFIILFLILRILAATHPIAAAAFSIFNLMGSFVLSLVKGLTPNAVQMSKLVCAGEFNKYKETLDKIVDTIEELKRNGKIKNHDYTISELLLELDKIMDKKDKECVEELVKNQNWR